MAADLDAKLALKADFVPSDKSTLDRLVGIAKHYKIPMGIEWIGGTGAEDLEVPAAAVFSYKSDDLTVRQILDGLVKANGNALWIAEFNREDFAAQAKSNAAAKQGWRFVPLRDSLAVR